MFANRLFSPNTHTVHFGQGIKSGRFQMLDYMSVKQNEECYGSQTPPTVHVENINVTELFLIHSDDDLLADTEDVERLKRTLRGEWAS